MRVKSIVKKCVGEDLGLDFCEKQATNEVMYNDKKYYFCPSCLNKFKQISRKTNIGEWFPGKTSSFAVNPNVSGVKSFSGFGKEKRRKSGKEKLKEREYKIEMYKLLLQMANPKIEWLNKLEIQRVEINPGVFICYTKGKPIYFLDKYYKIIGYI